MHYRNIPLFRLCPAGEAQLVQKTADDHVNEEAERDAYYEASTRIDVVENATGASDNHRTTHDGQWEENVGQRIIAKLSRITCADVDGDLVTNGPEMQFAERNARPSDNLVRFGSFCGVSRTLQPKIARHSRRRVFRTARKPGYSDVPRGWTRGDRLRR